MGSRAQASIASAESVMHPGIHRVIRTTYGYSFFFASLLIRGIRKSIRTLQPGRMAVVGPGSYHRRDGADEKMRPWMDSGSL